MIWLKKRILKCVRTDSVTFLQERKWHVKYIQIKQNWRIIIKILLKRIVKSLKNLFIIFIKNKKIKQIIIIEKTIIIIWKYWNN